MEGTPYAFVFEQAGSVGVPKRCKCFEVARHKIDHIAASEALTSLPTARTQPRPGSSSWLPSIVSTSALAASPPEPIHQRLRYSTNAFFFLFFCNKKKKGQNDGKQVMNGAEEDDKDLFSGKRFMFFTEQEQRKRI